jgi:hypothetical protein
MIAKLSAWLVVGAMTATAATGKWTAQLEPKGDAMIKGSAQVESTDSASVSARISVEGGKEGEQLPWHVHTGTCDNSGPPIGGAAAYKPLTIGSDGRAESEAMVSVTLSDSASYAVNVHRSPSDNTVISCGTLRGGSIPTPQE